MQVPCIGMRFLADRIEGSPLNPQVGRGVSNQAVDLGRCPPPVKGSSREKDQPVQA